MGHGSDQVRVVAQVVETVLEDIHDLGHALAEVVPEVVLPGVLPDVLHRIEFWAVGRKENGSDRGGDYKVGRLVPSSTVQADGAVLSGKAVGHMGQEEAHQGGIDPRKDQGDELPVGGADGSVGVDVLPDDLGRNPRPKGKRAPAPSAIVDPAIAGLVLEQQPERNVRREIPCDFPQDLREVFLKASRASALALGWCERGASFLHSFRWRSL